MKNIFLSLIITLAACNPSRETKKETQQKDETTDNVFTMDAVTPTQTIISESGNDCIRGEPTALSKKGSFKKAVFERSPDRHTGIETIELENGDKVIIKNWGCEYFALTFRFETSRFEGELSNTGFWYKRIASVLNEISEKLDAPIDIVKGTERIATEIENDVPNGYQNLKLNKELDFEDNPRSFVRIDKLEKLDGQKFAMEVTFAKGPL
jgi:hypothetical protein